MLVGSYSLFEVIKYISVTFVGVSPKIGSDCWEIHLRKLSNQSTSISFFNLKPQYVKISFSLVSNF